MFVVNAVVKTFVSKLMYEPVPTLQLVNTVFQFIGYGSIRSVTFTTVQMYIQYVNITTENANWSLRLYIVYRVYTSIQSTVKYIPNDSAIIHVLYYQKMTFKLTTKVY